MKKAVSISFILLYLMLSVGVVKSTHLCMGRVMETNYFSFDSAGCFDMSNMKDMMNHCCDNETELLKIEEDHQSAEFSELSKSLFEIAPILLPIEFNSLTLVPSFDKVPILNSDPPPTLLVSLHQLECRYTLYG